MIPTLKLFRAAVLIPGFNFQSQSLAPSNGNVTTTKIPNPYLSRGRHSYNPHHNIFRLTGLIKAQMMTLSSNMNLMRPETPKYVAKYFRKGTLFSLLASLL